MSDYKKVAALAALKMIEKDMIVGLGAGSTIAHLAKALAAEHELVASLKLVSSSLETIELLEELRLEVADAGRFDKISIYFDSCDQLDRELNALKSGGGIHTSEKILATMAEQFVLVADACKLVTVLDSVFPLTMEILPNAVRKVIYSVTNLYPNT